MYMAHCELREQTPVYTTSRIFLLQERNINDNGCLFENIIDRIKCMNELFVGNYASYLTFFVAFLELCFAIILLLGGKNISARYLTRISIATALWTALLGLHVAYPVTASESALSIQYLDTIPRLMHALGLVIGVLFLHFAVVFPENKKVPGSFSLTTSVIVLFFTCGLFFTNLILGGNAKLVGEIPILGGHMWLWGLGPYIIIYDIVFMSFFIGGIALLAFKRTHLKKGSDRTQVGRMIPPLLIGISFPGIVSIILPFFGIYSFNWMAGIGQIVWVAAIGYAVVRHDQMKVRYVTTELLIIAALGLLFASIFI